MPLWPLLRRVLPKWLYERIVLIIYGWEFHEGMRPFREYSGPRGNDKTFMLVTCGRTELNTRDAELVNQILGRPRDFQQLDLTDLFMAKFGHNVLTSNGDRWARQKKVVASVINERISKAVFNESIRQTHGLIDEVHNVAAEEAGTNKLFDMIKKITIHVLSGAGMGVSVQWSSQEMAKPRPGFKMTYIEAVKVVIEGITGPIILPQWLLSNYPSFLPGHHLMNSVSHAIREFPVHTQEMLAQERQRSKSSKEETRSNIMSQLLQASDSGADGKGSMLSDEEMMGNLFVFTAAGFDTTANTLSYALVLLARHPRWQDWLIEEVDAIVPADMTDEQLEYTAIFPKATRVLSFMFETLRLFTPIIHIAKQTRTAQTLETSQGRYWLPAKTTCYIDGVALHLNPDVWRNLNIAENEESSDNDEDLFRPTRWLNPSGSAQAVFQPPKGAYVPWSAGPRVCPGQKMAQVEFTAVILSLLRRHRVEAVVLESESRQQMEARLDAQMRKSISILTLQMDGVYDVGDDEQKGLKLRLKRRG